MKRIISEIALSTLIFTAIDAIWIMLVMKDHFNELIIKIQGTPMEPNFVAAILCYICLIGGLYYFVINRVKSFNIVEIISLAVPFGLTVYGTYDFTTATILKNWDLGTAFMDLAWGAVLCTLTTVAVVYFRSKFFREEVPEVYDASHERDS